jgi:hypothetical protein
MKNLFILNDSRKIHPKNDLTQKHKIDGTQIEIRDEYIFISTSHKSESLVTHMQNIKFILKDVVQQTELKEDRTREDRELIFKFAAIVIDRLFLCMASIYSLVTLIGLVLSV